MRPWIRSLFAIETSPTRSKTARKARMNVENLESRQVPTVSFHGGAVLPHVEVQGIYLGSDFLNNSTYYQQTGQLEGFLGKTATNSYLSALGNNGYGVGTGSVSQGRILPVNIAKNFYLTDATIQSDLEAYIHNGQIQQPDANRLYVVFVEDNVAVKNAQGENSQKDFLGYHGSFAGTNQAGQSARIRYAVITTPGGTVGNAADNALSGFDSMTQTASHELAESVTDPDLNAYYETSTGNEIGDITNAQTTYLNGYAVQRISDKYDHAITPTGAAAYRPVSFILQSNGNFSEHSASGLTTLFGQIARVSDQGVDNNGRAFVDIVTNAGVAYEYHDGDTGARYLASGVRDAVAGQGQDYLLYTNGSLYKYSEATGQSTFIINGVVSISAGTDRNGINDVDVIYNSAFSYAAYEISDTSGSHYITNFVANISAGQNGENVFVNTAGNAYEFRESIGYPTFLASNVNQVTAGTDGTGSYQVDLLYNSGTLLEYRPSTGYVTVGGGIKSISKGHAGTIEYVTSAGNVYDRSLYSTIFLAGSAAKAG